MPTQQDPLDPFPGNLKRHTVSGGGLAAGKQLGQLQRMLNERCGLYITLLPHGYEIDWVEHSKYLELTLNDQSLIVRSECRDFGQEIDVDQLTEQIIELIRSKR